MKKQLLSLCLVALLFLVGWTSYGQKQSPSSIAWEYRVEGEGGVSQRQVTLSTLGAVGWELVAVTTGEEVIGESHYPIKTYYFKRPK